jgi:hypothetical protein
MNVTWAWRDARRALNAGTSVRVLSSRRISLIASAGLALVAGAIIGLTSSASADWLNTTGAETAPNFAEIDVLDDRARVVLEIDLADYAVFVPAVGAPNPTGQAPALQRLAASLDTVFTVRADEEALSPNLVEADIRLRSAKPTAIRPAGMPSRRPGPGRSADVVRAVLEYPFSARPAKLNFAPPLDADGRAAISLGFIARHLRVPITDYRYLSRPETLNLNWDDPWYSEFENPILARHHRSALMSFISIEPREIRHEIILRLRDLERWADLGLGETRTLAAEQLDTVKRAAARFLVTRNPIVVDGQPASPAGVKVDALDIGVAGLKIVDEAEALDRSSALFGVIVSYPQARLPSRLTMTWDLFPEGEKQIPTWVADPAGGVPGQVTAADPEVTWKNYLKTWTEPATTPVTVDAQTTVNIPVLSALFFALAGMAVVRAIGTRKRLPWIGGTIAAGLIAVTALPFAVVRVPLPVGPPDEEIAGPISRAMVRNTAAAMLEVEPERFKAALKPFVSSDAIDSVGQEMRRGLSVSLPSGARALTEAIRGLEVEKVTRHGEKLSLLAHWTAQVSGGHWGHMHRRQIGYRALLDVTEADSTWKLDGLTIISARPSS